MDRRLRVATNKNDLSSALMGTNFSFKKHLEPSLVNFFHEVADLSAGVRKTGAAALEIAYVAANRIDGFVGFNLCPWDIAAGLLIMQESGGMISDLSGEKDPLNSGEIIAGAPKIVKEITNIFNHQE